jgi:hypothetical protein
MRRNSSIVGETLRLSELVYILLPVQPSCGLWFNALAACVFGERPRGFKLGPLDAAAASVIETLFLIAPVA